MPEELLFTVIDNLTGKEPDTSEIALHEEWAQDLLYCDIDGWVLGDAGDLGLCDDTGKVRWAPLNRFTWTSALKAERDKLKAAINELGHHDIDLEALEVDRETVNTLWSVWNEKGE